MKKKKPRPAKAGAAAKKNITKTRQPLALPLRGLPEDLLASWAKSVLETARLPRKLRLDDLTSEEILAVIVDQEAATVRELWEIYNQERRALSKGLLGTRQAATAYLLGFHLPNLARARMVLERLAGRYDWSTVASQADQVVWTDLGCGTGAIAQAGLHFLRQCGFPAGKIRVFLNDTQQVLLQTAAAITSDFDQDVEVKTAKFPLEELKSVAPPPAQFHALSLGYVWNELSRNPGARARIMAQLDMQISSGAPALAVFLEPAQQEHSRAVMELHDQLIARQWHALYPCPVGAGAKPCPMLKRSRDWCYSESAWQRPVEVMRMDRRTGTDHGTISTSALVLGSPALLDLLRTRESPAPVVVGRPRRKDQDDRWDYLTCLDGALSTQIPRPPLQALPRGSELRTLQQVPRTGRK